MNYVIVTTEWCAVRGILLTPEMRKSLDGAKVILHDNFVRQFLSEDEKTSDAFRAYAHDDAEFREILSSPDWTPEEEAAADPSVTSDYGVVAGVLNAEKSVRAGIQTMALTDTESLKVKDLYPEWESKMGQQVNAGEKYRYGGRLWKVLQQHTVQENWKPGEGTESLYTEVMESHAGTKEDPIPYNNNMELEEGKYYSQDGVTYLCTRDTKIPVYNPLSELVGIYVEVAK